MKQIDKKIKSQLSELIKDSNEFIKNKFSSLDYTIGGCLAEKNKLDRVAMVLYKKAGDIALSELEASKGTDTEYLQLMKVAQLYKKASDYAEKTGRSPEAAYLNKKASQFESESKNKNTNIEAKKSISEKPCLCDSIEKIVSYETKQ